MSTPSGSSTNHAGLKGMWTSSLAMLLLSSKSASSWSDHVNSNPRRGRPMLSQLMGEPTLLRPLGCPSWAASLMELKIT